MTFSRFWLRNFTNSFFHVGGILELMAFIAALWYASHPAWLYKMPWAMILAQSIVFCVIVHVIFYAPYCQYREIAARLAESTDSK